MDYKKLVLQLITLSALIVIFYYLEPETYEKEGKDLCVFVIHGLYYPIVTAKYYPLSELSVWKEINASVIAPEYGIGAVGKEPLEDVLRVIRKNKAHCKEIWLVGSSHGGYMALMLGLKVNASRIIAISAPSNLKELKNHFLRNFALVTWTLPLSLPTLLDCSPGLDTCLLQRSPISHACEYREKILLIHGTSDWIVPFNQSIKLYRELEKCGVDASLCLVNGSHILPKKEVENCIKSWLFGNYHGAR